MAPNEMRQWWVVPGLSGGEYELRAVEVPRPGPTQVLIDVKAAGINRGELIARPSMTTTNGAARPARTGIEYAGVVADIGSSVTDWSIGQKVMGRGSACHADYTLADGAGVMAMPTDLSFEQAAAIPNVFVTAHDALVTNAALQPNETVLITAGSSGVGTAAIQIARRRGARHVLATSRSPRKSGVLQDLGATAVVDSTNTDWVDHLIEDHGEVDIVIDQIGGELFGPSLESLAVQGRYVTVGRTGGKQASIDLDLVARKRLSLMGVTFRTRSPQEALACSRRFVDDLLPAFSDGSLRPVLDRSFPLEDLAKAHQYMGSDRQIGKIVLVT